MVQQPTPYNPLEKQHLAESVARALLRQPITLLPPNEPFLGAGVYAIYYAGSFPEYEPITVTNKNDRWDSPIYVGQAIPQGTRRGEPRRDAAQSKDLYSRLRQHARSIDQAENLDVGDFHWRSLVVDDIWISLAESSLIAMFWRTAVWNRMLDGFGNHDPGSGRFSQRRSAWDTVHPGREFATRLVPSDHDAEWWRLRITRALNQEEET